MVSITECLGGPQFGHDPIFLYLITWSKVLERLIVFQSRYLHFMEPTPSLPYSQKPAICPHPELSPVHTLPTDILRYIFILYHLRLGLLSGLFP